MWPAVALFGGLVLLVVGAEWLIRGASRLALALGVPTLIIGLTVVAFGTSAPELAVTVRAAIAGNGGIGLGNVFGSNVVNVLFVLGASAAITPLLVSPQLIKVDVPVMIGASLAVLAFGYDETYSRLDGGILVGCLAGYLLLQYFLGRKFNEGLEDLEVSEDLVEAKPQPMSLSKAAALLVVGLVLLTFGAHWIVEGAVAIAQKMEIREEIIGLTIVSIGTSLPEIVTSLVAAARGERELAIGNIVGSNIFNIFAVLGVAAAVAPEPIAVSAQMLRVDIPVMVTVSVICFPIFLTGRIVSRKEGWMMLFAYVGYLGYQVYGVITGN